MKNSLSAVVALALGFGLASVGAHAHGMLHQQSMQQHHQSAQHAPRMMKQVQQQLKAEGFYKGRIDGVNGPETRHALAEFQRQNNLRPTARLDRNTLDRLMGGNRTVGVGSTTPNQEPNRNFTNSSGGSVNQQMTGQTATTPPNAPSAAPATEPTGPQTPAPGAGGSMPPQGAGGPGGGASH
jgi:peptidoglycan hydrolase-like protein with peptidoglycan-binding domain